MGAAHKQYYRNVFLKSDWWQDFRLKAMVHHKGTCYLCRVQQFELDVHHLWYRGSVWKTTLWDTRVLCRKCHELAHKNTEPKNYKGVRQAVIAFEEFRSKLFPDWSENIKKLRPPPPVKKEKKVPQYPPYPNGARKEKELSAGQKRQAVLLIQFSKGDFTGICPNRQVNMARQIAKIRLTGESLYGITAKDIAPEAVQEPAR